MASWLLLYVKSATAAFSPSWRGSGGKPSRSRAMALLGTSHSRPKQVAGMWSSTTARLTLSLPERSSWAVSSMVKTTGTGASLPGSIAQTDRIRGS